MYSFKKLNWKWTPSPQNPKFWPILWRRVWQDSTLYDILARFTHQLPAKRKIGSGRIAVKFNRTNIKRLKRRVNHQHGISQRALTKAFFFLIPFIKAYHENDEIVFWPDLASSHYAKDTIDFLKSNNIDFVDKSSNPTNAPELRPIEDFWVEMKRVVYANGWRAENLDQLTNRINFAFKKVS